MGRHAGHAGPDRAPRRGGRSGRRDRRPDRARQRGRAGRPYLLVAYVVVDAGARRTGVARALLAAARAHGEAAGCYELQLSADDPAAFAFYEAAGLAAAARTYKQYLDDDGRS